MDECWKFFRYAGLDELEEINDLIKQYNVWFSHLDKKHFIKKINNKECIYENGILITFKILKNEYKLGTFRVNAGNTILEQLVKNKKKSNTDLLRHVFIKFINCAKGSVYLAVNKTNDKAVNFYKKMNMEKIAKTKLDHNVNAGSFIEGYIFKSNKMYFGKPINKIYITF